MTRLRSAAQRAPQTQDQALALAVRFAAAATRIGELAARRASIIARVDAIVAASIVPLKAEQADIVKQLKPWFAANMDELTGGKRKSIELGGCVLGYRINPPKVAFAGGTDDQAVDALVSAELADELVRTTLALDKPAILKLLEHVPAEDPSDPRFDEAQLARLDTKSKLEELGFSVKQSELFFVDLSTKVEPGPATVHTDDEVR